MTGSMIIKELSKTDTHEVMLRELMFKEVIYILEMIKSLKAPKDGVFLLSKVKTGDKLLWDFTEEGFKGQQARFEEINGTPVICFTKAEWEDKKVRSVIVKILPLEDLNNLQRISVDGEVQTISSRDIGEMTKMKVRLSEKLRFQLELSEVEKKVLAIVRQRDNERKEKERQECEAKEREAEKLRKERIDLILAREKVSGYTEDGLKKFGYPIVEAEEMLLPDKTFVVLVESYNDETGACGKLLEAFQVSKKKGKFEKKNTSKISEKPVKAELNLPKGRLELFDINGSFKQVVVYKDMDDVHAMQAAGLNGGTIVTIEVKDEKGRYQLYAVTCDKIETIGHAISLL